MPSEQAGLDLPADAVEELMDKDSEMVRESVLDPVEKKFLRLRDEWKSKRGHEPSTMKVMMLPAYQQIIGMGPVAIPLLLQELATNLDNWFWALMAITGENPVPENGRGNGKAMAQAWLDWGKECGYEW